MNWDWAALLDQIWRSPMLPMWLTLAVAGFFALIFIVILFRAQRSVANGALAVLTLLAISVAVASAMRGTVASDGVSSGQGAPQMVAGLPALACLDDLAGETALTACEKLLFGSPDSVAAAVAYAAAQISRLTAYGDVSTANRNLTPDLQALRRAVERDRYGLIGYVLATRDRCQPGQCAAYASLTDHKQIAANMNEQVYEASIIKYSPGWSAAALSSQAGGFVAGAMAAQPSGKPTTTDFPSAASIPPVNIMTPEPPPATAAPQPPPRAVAAPAPAAPKKQAAPRPRPTTGPVQLAPAPSTAPATGSN